MTYKSPFEQEQIEADKISLQLHSALLQIKYDKVDMDSIEKLLKRIDILEKKVNEKCKKLDQQHKAKNTQKKKNLKLNSTVSKPLCRLT